MAEGVTSHLGSMRELFDRQNEVESLERRIAQNTESVEVCTSRRDIRRRNALLRTNETLKRTVARRLRKRQLFDVLATDVREAADIASAQRRIQWSHAPAKEPEEADSYKADVNLLLEDVILVDNGEHLQDARAQVDDVCVNCGQLMERNLQLSYLVCPNLDCGHMRWYIDTSTYNGSAYTSRSEAVKNAPKCVTHYSTFLNTSQGKTTKRFSKDFLMKICFYCYVEGARSPSDITKEIVNKAQKYLGSTEYNISTILKTQLRGDSLRLPPEVVKKLQLLFKAMWPVFAEMKRELNSERANMINFNFVSRVLCRLLGYDVFLPLFDKFRMPSNEIRHSAFMRQMFQELDWVWENEKLTDIPDSMLDEYQRRMLEEEEAEEEWQQAAQAAE